MKINGVEAIQRQRKVTNPLRFQIEGFCTTCIQKLIVLQCLPKIVIVLLGPPSWLLNGGLGKVEELIGVV